jgi:ribose-phosphate pyrophosphokinase
MELRGRENDGAFFTPAEQEQRQESPRGKLLIASCRSGTYLADKVVGRYKHYLAKAGADGDLLYLEDVDFQFSDSESCVRLGRDVSGHDVFLLQALVDPNHDRSIDENYVAFFIAVRAFREWGANEVTAVLPYLAYARQDKPTRFKREPTTAKLMADLSIEAGVDRLVTWDPHSDAIHGFYDTVPVHKLESLSFFTDTFGRFRGREDVVAVAPDAGASKLVTHFARELHLNSAIASKHRPRPEEAVVTEVIGDFAGKRVAIVLDDMISSGGTVYALIKKLVEEKGIETVHLGVSHNLGQEMAQERLSRLHADGYLKEMIVTNSIPQTEALAGQSFMSVRDLSGTLCRVINRIHYNEPVDEQRQ